MQWTALATHAMPDWALSTPVALFVYNRPDTTRRVFDAIRSAQPPKLFVIADGPQHDRPDDLQNCESVRAIVEDVDWQCEILTNYADANLGCKVRLSGGLNWVFELAETAIILEDDCLPHPTFFRYCEELLARYRDEDGIMHIGGSNFHQGSVEVKASILYSRYPHVWGWATWRRAWQNYDVAMTTWASTHDKGQFLSGFENHRERSFWTKTWNRVAADEVDTWDYQWVFACIAHAGLAVVPAVNLVSNIGFASNATHTRNASPLANLPTGPMSFPMIYPSLIERDAVADNSIRRIFFTRPTVMDRIRGRLRRRLHFRIQ